MPDTSPFVRQAIEAFCREFVDAPYLCYTEQGLHARFYGRLLAALPEHLRYLEWEGRQVCAVQKEYPTAAALLDDSDRGHWDISVIKTPPKELDQKRPSYDYLRLDSAVEFGLNATWEHLARDVERLCDGRANVENRFIVHLYRVSGGVDEAVSGRDQSPDSEIVWPRDIESYLREEAPKGVQVEVYLGLVEAADPAGARLWRVTRCRSEPLLRRQTGSGHAVE